MHSFRCQSCLRTSCRQSFSNGQRPATGRRLSGAVNIIRANPFATSTLLYTAIFATATAAEGDTKRKRREKWDDKIAAVKQEIDDLQKAAEERAKSLLEKRAQRRLMDFDQKFSVSDTAVLERARHYPNRREALRYSLPYGQGDPQHGQTSPTETPSDPQLDWITDPGKRPIDIQIPWERGKSTFSPGGTKRQSIVGDVVQYPHYAGAPQPPPIPNTSSYTRDCAFNKPPQSLWAPQSLKHSVALRFKWAARKLVRMEYCAMRLVLELFHTLAISDMDPSLYDALPPIIRPFAAMSYDEQSSMLLKIDDEMRENWWATCNDRDTRLPRMRLGLPQPYYEQCSQRLVQELNYSIASLLDDHHQGRLSKSNLVIRLCANLLMSPEPPDVQTCNILLTGFLRLEYFEFVDFVVDLCYDGRIRPNEVTNVMVLRSFRLRNDEKRFSVWLGLMRGKDGGLMRADPNIVDFSVSMGRCFLREGFGSRYCVQAITPSPLVYVEIIQGILKFFGLRTAVEYCENLDLYGWGLNYPCLHDLLSACMDDADWERGEMLWNQARKLAAKGYPIPSRLYAKMLALCRICDRSEEFANLFDECFKRYWRSCTSQELLELVKLEMRLLGIRKEKKVLGLPEKRAVRLALTPDDVREEIERDVSEDEEVVEADRELDTVLGKNETNVVHDCSASKQRKPRVYIPGILPIRNDSTQTFQGAVD